jgi:TusA-related sulfurtransferase
MTDKILQTESSIKTVDTQTAEQQGEDWIQAIIDQDFEHLTAICHPDIKSTMLLPKRIAHLESATDLAKQVEDWFGEYDLIQKEQSRVAMVGEKLAIFYRLRCKESRGANTIEQQLYCTVRDGRIEQLRLICSGFQPDLVSIATPLANMLNALPLEIQSSVPAIPQAKALLEFKANVGQGSTCALLTPYIKSRLGGLSTGEVLEVHVDDITAKGDIEAWSRLSGNLILKMDQTAGQELVIYIQKK